MKLSTLSSLALIALLVPTPTLLASHPFVNGDFENGSTGWTTWGASGCTHAVEPGSLAPPLGHVPVGRSYRLADSSASASCGIYQEVHVTPGLSYSVVADAHVHSGLVQLYLRWVDAWGNDVIPNFPQDTSFGTGTQILNVQGIAPPGTVAVRVWFYVPTSHTGDVHIDNVRFTSP